MEQASIVGVAVDYAQLRGLIAARRRELGLRQLEVDDMAGLQGGYTGKLEIGLRHYGDLSMGAMLGALGLSIAVVRSAGTYECSRLENAQASADLLKDKIKKRGAKGGRARARNMTALQRRKSARNALKVRWQKYRASRALKIKKIAPVVSRGRAASAEG